MRRSHHIKGVGSSHSGRAAVSRLEKRRAQLLVSHIQERRGIRHLQVYGKSGKVRYLPLHPVAAQRIYAYLERSGHHHNESKVPLFVPLRGRTTLKGVTANGIYTVIAAYAKQAGIKVTERGCMGCVQQQRPMRSRMRQTLPRSRPG